MSLSINSPWNTSTPTNLVFIDPSVDGFGSLLKGLKANSEAIILDSTQDGVAQISNFLANYQGAVESVQILSHGAAGLLRLGSASLNLDNLDQYQSALGKWFSPGSIDKSGNKSVNKPDLILYGCGVAEGDRGQEFINKLSQMTGADVAASTDLTGSAAKGGNWILEKATGVIEAGQAFTQKVRDAYQDVLDTFNVTTANDSGAGSLRQAIIDANGNAGLDDIFFDPSIKLIQPLSALPGITDPVNLDGRTNQSGTTPGVAIDGILAGTADNAHGIHLNNTNVPIFGGSSIRGLAIGNFGGSGLRIDRSDNNLIQYNYVGTDITGTVSKGNSRSMNPGTSQGLMVWASQNNNIRDNVISGNWQSGLVIFGAYQTYAYYSWNPALRRNSSGNQIINNKVGTDVTGSYALSNLRYGIFIDGSNTTVTGNVASANGYYPITGESFSNIQVEFASGSTIMNNSITGNTVGLNASRTVALPAGAAYGEIGVGWDNPAIDQGNRATGNFYSYNSNYVAFDRFSARNPPAKTDVAGNNAVGFTLTRPTLTPIAPQLTNITSNQPVNNGDLIDTLVGSSISGTPGKGIGVVGVNDTNGTWQYSTDNGTSWSGLGAAVNTAMPSGANSYTGTPKGVFMLAADGKNRVRFMPNVGFTGIVTGGVNYMAWSQFAGGNGMWNNINESGRKSPYNWMPQYGFDTFISSFNSPPTYVSGITGALVSGTTDNFKIEVLPGNIAPVLNPILITPLAPIAKNPATNPGTLVSGLIPGLAVTDPDVGALKGIAVTGVDNSNGTWQYALDGVTWTAFGTPSATNARLLKADATTRVRFVPNAGYEGAPSMDFRAWDQVIGTAGGTTDVSVNGGVTAFSNVLGTVAIAVGNATVPPPVIPPAAPATPPSPPLDPGVYVLLKNPDAPSTPKPVVVGAAPQNNDNGQENGGAGGIDNGTGGNPNGGNVIAGNADCPCETIIKQKEPNPVIGTIQGTPKKDILVGTANINTIYGLQGRDTITGTPNPDNLYGGQGDDLIRGLGKRDFIKGGGGNDIIYGGKGADVIFGEKGRDTIYGGRGNDFISGGEGKDTIYGDRGNDFISGGKGSDRLFGGAGNDTICGCEGNDTLWGGKGKDILKGGKGNDLLIGGKGRDTLTGGEGSDRFRLQVAKGTDTITDFTVGVDFLELARGLKLSDLQITQGVGATVIGLQPGNMFASDKPLALLTGVNAASLTPNSFLVV